MTRVLVVQTAFLGDLVLTTPLLRELRRVIPDPHFTVISTPHGDEVFARQETVDEVWVHDKRNKGLAAREVWPLARRLLDRRFEIAVAAHRSHYSGLLVRASGAKTRIGFAAAPGSWAYTADVPHDRGRHAVRRYLELARPFGGEPERADPQPAFPVSAEESARADGLLAAEGIPRGTDFLAVAPGSTWATKRWLPEGFAEVLRAGRDRGLRSVLVGSVAEVELCRAVAEAGGPDVPVLAGRTDVGTLVAVLARSRALVSNDSGPAHLATAVGTPVVDIFGPTVPAFGYAPLGTGNRVVERTGLDCRPCGKHGARRCPFGHFRCMREIESSEVIRAVDDVLSPGESPDQAPSVRPG